MHWNLINQNYNAQDYYDILYEGVHIQNNNSNTNTFAFDDIEVRAYHDPWEDYYQQLELQHNETTSVSNNWQQTVDNELDENYRQPSATNIENLTHSNLHKLTTARHNDHNNNNNHNIATASETNSCEIVHNQTDENYSNKIVHNSSIIEITTRLQNQAQVQEVEEEEQETLIDQEVNNVHMNEEQAQEQINVVANEHCIETEVYHCLQATNCTNVTAIITTTTTATTTTETETTNNCDDETIERDMNKDTYITYHKKPQITVDGLEKKQQQQEQLNSTENVVEEVKGISYWCRHLGIFCISLYLCVCVCVSVCLILLQLRAFYF